jgi:peptidyl-prolyl cis-trans isomerase B (cyclophilin B)
LPLLLVGCGKKAAPEEDTMNAQNPIATITMEDGGVIKLELYPEIAPNTVKNFIHLANSGFYDGVIFHRVIEGFMIQGGDPDGRGTGGPGYRIKGEFSNNNHKNDLSHERGVISMARQGNPYFPASAYNTAGSQFFIMHADSDFLDGDYAAFGKVIEGMDVVDRIATTETDGSDRPLETQTMQSVRVDTFGVDYGEPDRIAE